jgi:tol-pal system protein YbgF
MSLSRTILALLALSPLAMGASKEIQELQRDVALLQDQINKMQKDFGDRLVTMQTLVQQTLESVNRTNTAVAVMENKFNDALKQQQQSVGPAVANVGQKLDQMSEDFRAVRESVLDMNTRMSKLDAKMADLQNLVSTMQRPAPPPPQSGETVNPGSAGITTQTPTAVAPPPGLQAGTLYTSAFGDYHAGKYDLAMQEFSDYLKYFPKTDFAPNAEFYIGDIHYRKQDYENALQAFDAVLEQYSENSKTPDAQYMKGRTLVQMGKRDAAAKEFRDIIAKYPDNGIAAQAKDQLKQLGLSVGTTPRRRTKSR